MSYINENFLELQDSYLFSTIAKKVAKYMEENLIKGYKTWDWGCNKTNSSSSFRGNA